MVNRFLSLLAAAALVAGTATGAWARGPQTRAPQTPMQPTTTLDQQQAPMPGTRAPGVVSQEGTEDQVAGVRIVPSILARDVFLTPSAWFLRGKGQNASA